MIKDYVVTATEYAQKIVTEEIVACEYVQQACQRQLNDLENGVPGYYFDPEIASRVCKLIELLPHIKGKWARERKHISLEPWQIFILTTVFGWVDDDGLRRFKTVYTEIPRKNAKSTLTSGVALYLLSADKEEGAEVYSAATTRDQARIVWQDAKRMVERTPGLQKRFGVATSAHTVYVEQTASVFKPLSRDQGGNLDGLNIHGGLIDELHAHKTRDVFDVIETGTGARDQPLLWLITTAGFNKSGICFEQRSYVTKILNGAVDDPEYFGIIYTMDAEDLENEEKMLTDPALWEKANPNWNVSVNPSDIERKARKAFEMPSARNNFLTKHLNVWVNADTSWMDMLAWGKCGDSSLKLEDYYGKSCWVAADLASKTDIASVAYVFEENGIYTAFVRNYLNEDAAEEGSNSQYSGWSRMGYLTLTPGNVTDYAQIEQDILDSSEDFNLTEVAFDPWQAEYMRQCLAEQGINTVELRATVANFSAPMKELQALVLQNRIRHQNCPVLNWMMSNVVAHLDAKDNIYPRKEFPENKIDGVVALIMAFNRALSASDQQGVPGIEIW
ncbi:MAG: terminase large subunit [Candidatus Thiodiazotropha lotti]|nr:terminase large subunit [Candidatus Thiodiazotropha lotti]